MKLKVIINIFGEGEDKALSEMFQKEYNVRQKIPKMGTEILPDIFVGRIKTSDEEIIIDAVHQENIYLYVAGMISNSFSGLSEKNKKRILANKLVLLTAEKPYEVEEIRKIINELYFKRKNTINRFSKEVVASLLEIKDDYENKELINSL